MGAIYRIWNTQNGKSYIGQSYRPYNRILQHFTPHSDKGSCEIHDDLHKYPPKSWKWEIVADAVDEETCKVFTPLCRPLQYQLFFEGDYHDIWHISVNDLERECIRQYDSRNPSKGYNITPGGGVPYRKTINESHLALQVRTEINTLITAYRAEFPHGIRRAEYRLKHPKKAQRQRQLKLKPVLHRWDGLRPQKEKTQHQQANPRKTELSNPDLTKPPPIIDTEADPIQTSEDKTEIDLVSSEDRPRQKVQEEGCWTTFLIHAGLLGLVFLLVKLASC